MDKLRWVELQCAIVLGADQICGNRSECLWDPILFILFETVWVALTAGNWESFLFAEFSADHIWTWSPITASRKYKLCDMQGTVRPQHGKALLFWIVQCGVSSLMVCSTETLWCWGLCDGDSGSREVLGEASLEEFQNLEALELHQWALWGKMCCWSRCLWTLNSSGSYCGEYKGALVTAQGLKVCTVELGENNTAVSYLDVNSSFSFLFRCYAAICQLKLWNSLSLLLSSPQLLFLWTRIMSLWLCCRLR